MEADFVDMSLDDSLLSAAPTATDSATQGEWVGTPTRRRGRPRLRMALGGLGLVTATVAVWLLATRARPAGQTVLIAHEMGGSLATPPKLGSRPEARLTDPAAFPSAAISAPSASLSAALPSASSTAAARAARPAARKAVPVRPTASAISPPRIGSPTTDGWENER
jgi:hypothetical protein